MEFLNSWMKDWEAQEARKALEVWEAQKKSLKHLSLLKCARGLVVAVAADPLDIAERLLEKGIVSEQQVRAAQLQTKENHLKASELVMYLIDLVGSWPEKYESVLGVLDEVTWLRDIVKRMKETHRTLEIDAALHNDYSSSVCKIMLVSVCYNSHSVFVYM